MCIYKPEPPHEGRVEGLSRVVRLSRFLYVRHKATRKTAMAQKLERGLILVQFDDIDHPQSHGWHLYPRHQFERRKLRDGPAKNQLIYAPWSRGAKNTKWSSR